MLRYISNEINKLPLQLLAACNDIHSTLPGTLLTTFSVIQEFSGCKHLLSRSLTICISKYLRQLDLWVARNVFTWQGQWSRSKSEGANFYYEIWEVEVKSQVDVNNTHGVWELKENFYILELFDSI